MIDQLKQRLKTIKATGQGLVEFALVIPIVLTMFYGIFEVGRALWIYVAVTTSSREAARYASAVSDSPSGTPFYLDCTGIRAAALRIGSVGNVEASGISISYDRGPGTTTLGTCPVDKNDIFLGDRVVIQVIGQFVPAPALPLFDFPTLNITSVTRRTILKEIQVPFITPLATATP